MKKTIFTLIAALTLCGAAEAQSPAADLEAEGWKRISPKELTDNPFVKVGDEWMAVAAGEADDMNAMTISWGSWGIFWGRPVVTVYVSSSRHTHSYLERYDYFTVTGFPAEAKPALAYIGSHSGRDGDKIAAAGLTPLFTPNGNPIFREANLAIECKMLYKQPLDKEQAPENIRPMYDKGTGVHSMYIGEVVNVWVKE